MVSPTCLPPSLEFAFATVSQVCSSLEVITALPLLLWPVHWHGWRVNLASLGSYSAGGSFVGVFCFSWVFWLLVDWFVTSILFLLAAPSPRRSCFCVNFSNPPFQEIYSCAGQSAASGSLGPREATLSWACTQGVWPGLGATSDPSVCTGDVLASCLILLPTQVSEGGAAEAYPASFLPAVGSCVTCTWRTLLGK